jgi:hypothetical protein
MISNGARSIVGANNIGVVHFAASVPGGEIDSVIHRLCWQFLIKEEAAPVTIFTEHNAQLTIPSEFECPEVMR